MKASNKVRVESFIRVSFKVQKETTQKSSTTPEVEEKQKRQHATNMV
jgi:hypothetical protein